MRSFIMTLCLSMVISLMVGCTNKLTTQQSVEYIEIKAEEKKIEFVKYMLNKSMKELTTVSNNTQIITSVPKETYLFKLAKWLDANDCLDLDEDDWVTCYKETRVKLIQNTYELDKMVLSNYESNQNIKILKGNLNSIIESLDKEPLNMKNKK